MKKKYRVPSVRSVIICRSAILAGSVLIGTENVDNSEKSKRQEWFPWSEDSGEYTEEEE